MDKFMYEALKEAYKGIDAGEGGPFGSVIVRNGEIIGRGHNQVVKNADPTCHGEMQAIRDACKNVGSFDLSGSTLYTTGEPCPMCLGAILWANIEKVYYGANIVDTAEIGFRDERFYEVSSDPEKKAALMDCLDRSECLVLYRDYLRKKGRTSY